MLLQALADFPAVVARRIDAEAHADSAWHGIGRALAAQGVPVPTQIPTAIELVEFGGTAIILDGEVVRPILAKYYELLGFLAARNGAPASRDELLNALFDARDDESARSYLRWIEALSPVVPVGDVGFAEAQLMLAIARDDQRHGTPHRRRAGRARAARAARCNIGTRRRADGVVADHEQRQQVRRCDDDVEQRLLDGLEQRVLHRMSSIEYPDSVNSGKTATATLSSWHARASPSTDSALAAGSPMVVCWVQAATRTNPCR